MTGHIRLGATASTLEDYNLVEAGRYQAATANPFAANISTSGPFSALSSYAEWVAVNWEEGVGKRDTEIEGMLYAQMDSRFPSQLILPLGLEYPYSSINPSGGAEYASGDSTEFEARSTSFLTSSTSYSISSIWVYVDAEDGAAIRVRIKADVLNLPIGATVCTGYGVITKVRPGPIWQRVDVENTALSTNTRYHVVVDGDDSLTLPAYTAPSGEFAGEYVNGVWEPASNSFGFVTSFVRANNALGLQDGAGSLLQQDGDEFLIVTHGDRFRWIVKCNGRLFGAYGNTLYEFAATSITSILDTGTAAISDVVVVDTAVWVAYGAGYKTYETATNTVADDADDADLLAVFGGYVWRADGDTLHYSADGSIWTSVGVLDMGEQITGLAGMNREMYASTARGLFVVQAGDVVAQVLTWPHGKERNGAGMVEWDGALYCPLSDDIIRYDGNTVQQVGLRSGEELPHDIQGQVAGLQPTNYFLLASMAPTADDGSGSLWAWNNHGWHNLALLPQGAKGGAVLVDSDSGYLYWGGSYGLLARAVYPASVVNPIRDRGTKLFARTGWIEYDRFYGSYVALQKDFESVYVDTEAAGTISVYWKDQESTDWELLGTSEVDDFELRWSDYTTRPNSKWLRLGLLMRTDDETDTPIVRAHRLKFHTMTTDRWRWQLPIALHDQQQMLDGSINSATVAEMRTHLESMIASVPPVIFEDVDGTQIEVKITAATRNIARFDELPHAERRVQYIYTLTLEQVA